LRILQVSVMDAVKILAKALLEMMVLNLGTPKTSITSLRHQIHLNWHGIQSAKVGFTATLAQTSVTGHTVKQSIVHGMFQGESNVSEQRNDIHETKAEAL
jgi:hypothetical protein